MGNIRLHSKAFAGFTSVIAKPGLAGISSDLGPATGTYFVFVFVLLFAGTVVLPSELQSLNTRNVFWLAASAVTTAGSWIFITTRSS
jgi:transporter family protein